MRILITGGYGFIGSYTASKFNKEGAEIYIIDNMSCKTLKIPDFNHKFYKLDVSDKKCEEVFQSGKFDIVIHLAYKIEDTQSKSSLFNDAYSNILGLLNMLELSSKYAVKKFVYISSAEIYGNCKHLPAEENTLLNPITQVGISSYLSEFYLKKWNELYSLEYISLRVSNVYGYGGSGVVSKFIKRILRDKDLVIHGDGSQTRDFIYIEDVCEVIYKIVISSIKGIYNLSSNSETSLNDLIKNLKKIYPEINLLYKNEFHVGLKRSWLDNSKLVTNSDWSPVYSIQRGLEKTYNQYETKETESTLTGKTNNNIKKLIKPLISYIYNIAGFLLLLVAYMVFETINRPVSYGFAVFYIVAIGLIFGIKNSLVSSILTILGYSIAQYFIIGKNINSIIISPESISLFVSFIAIGFISGYICERHENILKDKETSLHNLEEKYSLLDELFYDTLSLKDKYQEQILSSEDSFNKVFNIVMELEHLEPEAIYNSSVTVLENVLKCNNILIHFVSENKKFARIVAHSKKASIEGKRSIKLDENFEYMMVEKNLNIHANLELKEGVPSLIGAVTNQGKTIAIVSVNDVEFEKMNQNYINLFKMLTKMISHALSRALKFEDMNRSEYFIRDTPVLKKERFKVILQRKIEASNKFGTPYTILSINISDNNIILISHIILNHIRETDYIGEGESDELLILLSNTKEKDSKILLERLENQNIKTRILNAEESSRCLALL